MMSNLRELIPGAAHWPHFVRNQSEQFEARLAMVEVLDSPSLFFKGMAGSKMPIAVAHGEGYAEFSDATAVNGLLANKLVTMRFIDHASMPTTSYPYNPNGSPQGITGLTSTDGRFSIMMPHPERVIRNVQNTWQRCGDSEDSAWIRMFRNARRHIN
jgi:phosphoribosylformylglycinamidine synthase